MRDGGGKIRGNGKGYNLPMITEYYNHFTDEKSEAQDVISARSRQE